jgi:hypothetical protein
LFSHRLEGACEDLSTAEKEKNINEVEKVPAKGISLGDDFGDVAVKSEWRLHRDSRAGDVPEPKAQELKETDGKDKLVAALKASFDFCNTAMPKVTDAKLGDTIEFWGDRKAPRAFALIALTNDWADHYSAAAMYLRLNGLVPSTANK